MEGKVCKHLKSFERLGIMEREPDNSLSILYKIRCDVIKNEDGYLLAKHFDCFECSDCTLLKSFEFSETPLTHPFEEQKKDYDVISTSSSVKPEDTPRLAEAFASGTYIPGVTGNTGATSLDADGKSLLRHYSRRYGDIELQPYIRNRNYNDIVFEIVKWYPNTYYGKHNEYNIVGGTAYSKANPNFNISVSLLNIKECNYVISFIHLIRGKMIEPVSTRPGELEGDDLQNYNRLKRIAKYIVGNIIDSEKAAGENNFMTKRKEDDA